MVKKDDSINELKNALVQTALFISLPFVLVYIVGIVVIFLNVEKFYSLLDILVLKENLIPYLNGLIEKNPYGSTIFTILLTLIASYFFYITFLSKRNLAILEDSKGAIVNEFICQNLFSIFNFVLPIVITIFISKPFNLEGMDILLVFVPVVLVFQVLDRIKGKFFIIFIAAILILIYLFPIQEIKESLILFMIYAISNLILKKVTITASLLIKTYDGAHRFVLDKIQNHIRTIKPETFFQEKKKTELVEYFLVAFIVWLSQQTIWVAFSLIILGFGITLIAYDSSFTLILPLYFFLTLPSWVVVASAIRTLPKEIVTVHLSNGEKITDAIIIQEDHKLGYLHVITKDGLSHRIRLNAIIKIVRKIPNHSNN